MSTDERWATMHNTDLPTAPGRDDLDEAIERLLKDAREAQAAAQALRRAAIDEHDHSFATEIAQLVSALQLDIAVARAEWAIHKAHTSSDLGPALDEVARMAEWWLEDDVIQERLERSGDRAPVVTRWIEGVSAESKRAVHRVTEAVECDVEELRRLALRAIHSVRLALEDAIASLRHV